MAIESIEHLMQYAVKHDNRYLFDNSYRCEIEGNRCDVIMEIGNTIQCWYNNRLIAIYETKYQKIECGLQLVKCIQII